MGNTRCTSNNSVCARAAGTASEGKSARGQCVRADMRLALVFYSPLTYLTPLPYRILDIVTMTVPNSRNSVREHELSI